MNNRPILITLTILGVVAVCLLAFLTGVVVSQQRQTTVQLEGSEPGFRERTSERQEELAPFLLETGEEDGESPAEAVVLPPPPVKPSASDVAPVQAHPQNVTEAEAVSVDQQPSAEVAAESETVALPTPTSHPIVEEPAPVDPHPQEVVTAPVNEAITNQPVTDYSAPTGTKLAELEAYFNQVQPLIEQALVIAERDGGIIESAENNRDLLCEGTNAQATLVSDEIQMDSIDWQLQQIIAPDQVDRAVHEPLLSSVQLWSEALTSIDDACGAANELEKGGKLIGAGFQVTGAVASFYVAYNNYIHLAWGYGLQALVGQ